MLYRLIASFGGLGYAPVASGTVGAAVAWVIWYGLAYAGFSSPILLTGLISLFFILGTLSATITEKEWGEDSGKIVIDEVVGMWISLLFVPFNLWYMLGAFLLFRALDIFKPFYIRRMEDLKGGWGVMMDDTLAGLYTCLVINAIYYIMR